MSKTDSERLEDLKRREAELKARIAKIEARQSAEARKQETRLKIVVGAAMLADARLNNNTADFIRTVLARAVIAQRDRELLQAKGWLTGA